MTLYDNVIQQIDSCILNALAGASCTPTDICRRLDSFLETYRISLSTVSWRFNELQNGKLIYCICAENNIYDSFFALQYQESDLPLFFLDDNTIEHMIVEEQLPILDYPADSLNYISIDGDYFVLHLHEQPLQITNIQLDDEPLYEPCDDNAIDNTEETQGENEPDSDTLVVEDFSSNAPETIISDNIGYDSVSTSAEVILHEDDNDNSTTIAEPLQHDDTTYTNNDYSCITTLDEEEIDENAHNLHATEIDDEGNDLTNDAFSDENAEQADALVEIEENQNELSVRENAVFDENDIQTEEKTVVEETCNSTDMAIEDQLAESNFHDAVEQDLSDEGRVVVDAIEDESTDQADEIETIQEHNEIDNAFTSNDDSASDQQSNENIFVDQAQQDDEEIAPFVWPEDEPSNIEDTNCNIDNSCSVDDVVESELLGNNVDTNEGTPIKDSEVIADTVEEDSDASIAKDAPQHNNVEVVPDVVWDEETNGTEDQICGIAREIEHSDQSNTVTTLPEKTNNEEDFEQDSSTPRHEEPVIWDDVYDTPIDSREAFVDENEIEEEAEFEEESVQPVRYTAPMRASDVADLANDDTVDERRIAALRALGLMQSPQEESSEAEQEEPQVEEDIAPEIEEDLQQSTAERFAFSPVHRPQSELELYLHKMETEQFFSYKSLLVDVFQDTFTPPVEEEQEEQTASKPINTFSEFREEMRKKGFTVKQYVSESAYQYYSHNYININRIKFATSILTYIVALAMVILGYFVGDKYATLGLKVYIATLAALLVIPGFYGIMYISNRDRHAPANFSFKLSLVTAIIAELLLMMVFLLLAFFIPSTNANISQIETLVAPVFYPMAMLTLLPISVVIYAILYRSKRFHV